MTKITNPARARLEAGEVSIGCGLRQARTVDIAKAMKTCGFDWLFIDLELGGFLPDHNLNYTDKMAMRAGVEVRVPLVATQMVDFAANLTLSERIDLRRTKKILRDSQARRLPPAVLARPKQGFGVPLRAWLHGPARPLLDELTAADVVERRGLFDAAAVARLREAFHGQRIDAALTLFPLMAIELWCRALDAAPTADPP